MIVLLEPERPPGFVSGGYRYQQEIGAWLRRRGEGEVRACAPAALAATAAALQRAHPPATVVVDGLFAGRLGAALPDGSIALLHMAAPAAQLAAVAGVIATAEPTAASVRAAIPHVHVVRPGLDACFVPAAVPAPTPPVRVLCIGTVCPDKGQRLVVEALRTAPVPCELTLLGDVHTDTEYVAAVRAAAGSLPVTFAGTVPTAEVALALQRAHLCISASRRESFGMAVAEAVACGVPVVAFAAGEIASTMGDGTGRVALADGDAVFVQRVHEAVAVLPPRLPPPRPQRGWDVAAQEFVTACRAIAASAVQKRNPT